MLVLTRGMKQQIVIGGGLVTVTVLDVRGGRVRLGIEAPTSVSVRRKEIPETPNHEGPAASEAVVMQ